MEKYTVTEFTKRIKGLLKGTFPNIISVTGEVSNLSKASSGHIYFILKVEVRKMDAGGNNSASTARGCGQNLSASVFRR